MSDPGLVLCLGDFVRVVRGPWKDVSGMVADYRTMEGGLRIICIVMSGERVWVAAEDIELLKNPHIPREQVLALLAAYQTEREALVRAHGELSGQPVTLDRFIRDLKRILDVA